MKNRLAAVAIFMGLVSLPGRPLYAQDQPKPHVDKTLAAPAGDPAQEKEKGKDDKPKWDVAAPPYAYANSIPLDVDEGTWMTLDVTPDGKEIVFDLLGDIYTMPIAGGEAKTLTTGIAWDMQPRFSPDGKLDRLHLRPRGRRQHLGDEPRRLEPEAGHQGDPSGCSTRRRGRPTASTSRPASTSPPRARSARARSGSTTARAATACR